MLIGFLLYALANIDSALTSPAAGSACAAESPSIGSLLQREFRDSEFTESQASKASDLLYLSSVGLDLGANLAPKPWELLELDMEDYFANASERLEHQMQKKFDTMAQKMHLGGKYNAEELATFRDNFAHAVAHDTEVREKDVGVGKLSVVELKNFIKKEMILQQPVATEKIVKDVNRQRLGWVAGLASDVGKLTLQDFDYSLGYQKGSDAPIDSKPPASEEVAFLGQAENFDAPENFDARTGWPECAEIIGLVPDQGRCASCWALTTVGVFNDRLCIASGGVFRSQLSAADVLACDRNNYGCKGGNPAVAVMFLQKGGTVTGSGYKNRGFADTCFPYPIKNVDATKHFDSQVAAPECRSYCPELGYKRPYNKDKYFAAGNAYLIGSKYPHKDAAKTQSTWDSLKRVMTAKGSVMMMYAVGRSHVTYVKGLWDCPAGQPNHMVRCIAYGVDPFYGKYITCVQSWGSSWGEEGRFRMKFPGNGCIEMFMSIPVDWVGKNMRTGVPPAAGKPVWNGYNSYWKGLSSWMHNTIRAATAKHGCQTHVDH